jgi:GTP cyclohydrolase-4
VGVTNLKRIIRMAGSERESLFYAEMDLFAYLDQEHAGVHMSRFNDVLERLMEEITLEASPSIEAMAERLARQIVSTQHAGRSEVYIRAKYPLKKHTPVTGKEVEELYTFIGIAACNGTDVRRVVGVEVEGMTVCPCAQDMVRSHSKKLLIDEGFKVEEAEKIVGLIPLASHNQRGRGTLLIGTDQTVRAEHLVHVLEASMSSETYELLKRPDEFFVVNKAHQNPMFTEDVVREVFRNLVDIYPDLPDETFVLVKQENLESIHQHNAFAERSGTLGAIRKEMLEQTSAGEVLTLQEWLKF